MRYQYLADFLTVFRYFFLTVLRYWVPPNVPLLIGALSSAFRARWHLIACRLYPSHGLLRFITSRSLASIEVYLAKSEAPEEETVLG